VIILKARKPEPGKTPRPGKTLGVRFSGEQVEALQKISAREYRSISGLIKLALSEYAKAKGYSDWPEA